VTIISKNHNFIFIHIPKCGGSSIEIVFERYLNWGDFVIGSSEKGEILHQQIFNKLYGLEKHSTAIEIRKILTPRVFDAMEVVAVVREPIKIVESYYKFSKLAHNWIAAHFQNKMPNNDFAAAQLFVLNLLRTGRLNTKGRFEFVNLLNGTIKAGILSDSFEEFVTRVADDRWVNYLSSYTYDGSERLATRLIHLENKGGIEAYFQDKVGQSFKLETHNASPNLQCIWPRDMKNQYYDKMASEYERFEYRVDDSAV
jgi:Sulfotransferase family